MQYRVLKELPQGQKPGELIDVHEDVGRVLEQVGAAEKVAEAEAIEDEPRHRRRSSYHRRDLVAAEG